MHGNRDTIETFKVKADAKHGVGTFGYDQVEINKQQPIAIWCYKHNGLFYQKPVDHLSGRGCNLCRKTKQKTDDQWKAEFSIKHANRYDYSLAENIKAKEKVIIICPIHDIFEQEATSHLGGCGCPRCAFESNADAKRKTTDEFVNESTVVHNGKYTYANVIYINRNDNVIITCRKHGDFNQAPGNHLAGKGCSRCKESVGEAKTANYLTLLNIQYETQKKFVDCKNIFALPFDFYLPEFNALIEFDGRQHSAPSEHFGGEKGFRLTKINDGIKDKYAIDHNIPMLRINYNENIESRIDAFIMGL